MHTPLITLDEKAGLTSMLCILAHRKEMILLSLPLHSKDSNKVSIDCQLIEKQVPL
jgi:hypothetical protein